MPCARKVCRKLFTDGDRPSNFARQAPFMITRYPPNSTTPLKAVVPRWSIVFVTLWGIAVVAGLAVLWLYASTPGAPAPAGARWPTHSAVQLAPSGDTLVMFVHPQCPCSRATLSELEKIVAHTVGHLTPWVLFYRPQEADANWSKTDLWHTASAIPGVHLLDDVAGREASRFGATTSGQTMLFNASGNVLFSGGITSARGHAGDNAGSDAIVELVTTGKSDLHQTPVFGCSIRDTVTPQSN
jgi:hypothetical protein